MPSRYSLRTRVSDVRQDERGGHLSVNGVASGSYPMKLHGMLLCTALAVLPFNTGLRAQTPPAPNIGVYNQGVMAGRTPNLDRLANEGMRFTDYYAEAPKLPNLRQDPFERMK